MTYSIGGKIQAADFNEAINGGAVIPVPVGVNHLWNDGTVGGTAPGRQYGYGQTPALSTVAAGAKITAGPGGTPTEWQKMFATMNTIATHQGTTLTWAARHSTFPPTTGTKIAWETNLASSIASLSTNRFNAALQGGTATSVATTTATWSDKLTVTFTAAFASDAAARYFFNSGGQLGINGSHPAGGGTTINTLISDLCSDAGTVWLSAPSTGTISLAGTTYSGVTKVGGSNPSGVTISANSGFYAQTTTSTEIFKQFSDTVFGAYGTGTFMTISSSYNGTGTLTLEVVYDEVPGGSTVSVGTVTTMTVRSPSTSSLANSWGTPTLTNSIAIVNAPPAGITAEYLAVAGGGGAGGILNSYYAGGGGGAGGLLTGSLYVASAASITIVVGGGGAGAGAASTTPASGGDTTMSGAYSLTVTGGGFGGVGDGSLTPKLVGNGGSGGGGTGSRTQPPPSAGGLGIPGTGYDGGGGSLLGGLGLGGGGGGAGGAGVTAVSGSVNGSGGAGAASSIKGTSTIYAGGGSGYGGTNPTGWTAGPNTGDGGRFDNGGAGGLNGASGVLILAYPGTVARATGGTISTVSRAGYVVHTFTSSGTFTVL